jgi:hypothetical protein
MGLPSIGQRTGAFEVDKDYLRKANAELSRLADFDGQPDPFAPKPVIEDPRSMAEIMKAKREEAERRIEEQKQQPERESVEQRKARLLA